MEDISLIKKQEWYWFITSTMDCDQASVIRCFLAPIYLPYINNDNNVSHVDEQRNWIDFYEEKITLFYQTNESKDFINKNIFKVMGTYLCERVKQEKGIDCFKYLGKNRNVSQYPERFIYSIFPPSTDKGIFEELWSYFYQLLCQAFLQYDSSHIEEKLRRAEDINRNLSYFHVPKITTQATDVLSQEAERIAYLLCTFCVLNSALIVKQQSKNGLLLSDKIDIFEKAKRFLEITNNDSIPQKNASISIDISDLLSLNLHAIETDNFELLQIIQNLNEKNSAAVIQAEIDRNKLKEHLLHNIEKSERRLIRLMNSQNYEINKGAQVLMTLTNLEKFWKAIYNKV